MSERQQDGIPIHRIAQRFYNQPLWLQPSTAETISAFLLSEMRSRAGMSGSSHDKGESVTVFRGTPSQDGASAEFHSPRASAFHGTWAIGEDGRPLPYRRTQNGVAIISTIGELVNRGSWIGADSGLVSYEGIRHQFEKAAADKSTQQIIFDIESPGGEAIGAFETASFIREVAKVKTVIAIPNGLAASAGYALASAATRIVIPPTGMAGSIGVVMVHLDWSKFLEEKGIKPTMIFSGAHKVDGNPFEPLPDSVRARFQEQSQSFYDQFVDTVAAGRAGLSADRIRKTEALMFKGQDAVDAGLADSVGTFEDVLAEMMRGATGRTTSSINAKGSQMKSTDTAAAPGQTSQTTETKPATLTELQSAYPDLCGQLLAQGAATERVRVLAVMDVPAAGHADLVTSAIKDGKSSAADLSLAILTAEKATRGKQMQAIAGVEDQTGKVNAAPTGAGGAEQPSTAKTPEAWKAEYEKSTELQGEFDSAEAYVAYQQGVASGRIRILSRKAS